MERILGQGSALAELAAIWGEAIADRRDVSDFWKVSSRPRCPPMRG
jgi:hypothetical protein